MNIREFDVDDFRHVVRLLKDNGVEPPFEPEVLSQPCYVAEQYGEIIGIIFALAGKSTEAYVNYLAIRADYQGSFLFNRLLLHLERNLKAMGVKRYTFHLEKYNHQAIKQLYKYREKYQIKMLNDLHYFRREI